MLSKGEDQPTTSVTDCTRVMRRRVLSPPPHHPGKWFRALLARSQDAGQPLTPPEQRFLASLRQLIVDGWELTPELFKGVVGPEGALLPEDHKSAPLQPVCARVRSCVCLVGR